jgi:uncharacterized membrane protein
MSTDRPVEVDQYLQRLDVALAGVPPHTADDIRTGVAEELSSLDPDTARERIVQLGDPEFIAAEARAGTDERTPRRKPALESRSYIVVASLAIAFGIYLVPVVGALLGFVMVWASPAWKRWEKVLTTVIPLGAGFLTATFFVLARIPEGDGVSSLVPGFGVAAGDEFTGPWYALYFNPLVTINALFVISIANLAVGIWLLVRALRRS